MKRTSLVLFSFLLAAPLFAIDRFPVEANNLVRPLSATNALLIPVAGSLPGGFGTYFRSEIHIINYTSAEQLIELRWLPGDGTSGATQTAVRVTLPALTGFSSDDFVVDVLHRTGLGAITVTALTSDGSAINANGLLHATPRIYTKMPNSEGTVSQTFPSVPLTAVASADRQLIPSTMRNGGQYRMNAGVVNLSSAPQTYIVTVGTGTGAGRVTEQFQMDVPALALRQMNLAPTAQGLSQISIENVTAVSRTPSWLRTPRTSTTSAATPGRSSASRNRSRRSQRRNRALIEEQKCDRASAPRVARSMVVLAVRMEGVDGHRHGAIPQSALPPSD